MTNLFLFFEKFLELAIPNNSERFKKRGGEGGATR